MNLLTKTLFFTIAAVAAAVLCSCSQTSAPIKSSEAEAEIVATCDGHDIPFEQIRYLTSAHKADMKNEYGKDIWDTPESSQKYKDELTSRVENDIKTYSTVLSICKNHNIRITDKEIQEAVQKEIDYVVFEVYGGVDEYKKALAEGNMTDSCFRFIYGIYYCQNELYLLMTQSLGSISAPTDPEELYDLIFDEFYRTTHVYVPFNYGGNDKETNRAKAEDIYARLKSGEITFERAQFEGGTDQALPENGFYFSNGYAELAYEEASRALAVGETSELVELGDAFYIIKRLELDSAYVMGNMFTLRTQYLQSQFNSLLNDYKNKLEITYLKEMDLTAIN